jgi:hypothetical protein
VEVLLLGEQLRELSITLVTKMYLQLHTLTLSTNG